MKSRRDGIFILCIVFIAAVLAGCGAAEQRPVLGKIEYTNLNDSGSRELLQELPVRHRRVGRAYSGLFPPCGPLS